MKTPTLRELTADLKYLIKKHAEESLGKEDSPKNTLEAVTWQLKSLVNEAKRNKEDFKKNNLSINTIEAEGFLRCALSVEAILKDYKLI